MSSSGYPEDYQRRAFWQAVVERVQSLPGVRAVGASHLLPFADHTDTASFTVEGYEPAPGEGSPGGEYKIISPGFLRAMGIPLLKGRTFDDTDTAESERVVLIDETAARRYWPEQDPAGRRLSFSQNRWRMVVGVVGAVKSSGLEAEGRPQVYMPYTQSTPRSFSLVVHAQGPPLDLTPAIRREVLGLDRDLAIYDVRTLEQRVTGSLAQRRNSMALFLLFAGLGLLLAAVGLYSLISYSITQRTHEIGIRLALGAQPGDIFWLVVGHGMTLTLVGVAAGLAAAFAAGRTLSSLLFNLAPTDPLTLASVSGLLVVVAFAACAVPARRATRVHPLVALRYE
ncbi:MAG: FtsX-like permease family protein [Candidatus Acidiferrales bacterium]